MMWNFNSFQNNIAIITENNNCLSYEKLDNLSTLLYEKIQKRCLIFCLCQNKLGSLIAYTSFLNNKIVPLMLTANIAQELIEHLIEIYKPDYIHLPQSEIHRFSQMKIIYSHSDYVLLKTKYIDEFPLYAELALLLPTSGSTGSPKLVRQSYANIMANAKSIVEYLSINERERAITTLPMNYTYGLSILNTHLLMGASIILTDKTLMQKDFWKQIKELEASSIAGIPYTYEMLHRLKIYNMDLPALKTLTQAGGKLSSTLHLKFAQWAKESGRQFIVMYGQTEATSRMSYLPFEKSVEKLGSIGIAIPRGKFSLISAVETQDNRLDNTEIVGELIYEGENVTLGYAEKGQDLIKNDELCGILLTGDMARVDADGYYYIVGRKKRFLKIYGNRVNLDETECLILAQFADLDCACCGIDDKMYIFIVYTELQDEDKIKEHKAIISKFITKITNINNRAYSIKVIKDIPKNEAGKKLYKELEKYYD